MLNESLKVVLSNSSIVQANAAENPDLYWSLKGGGANFGNEQSATFLAF